MVRITGAMAKFMREPEQGPHASGNTFQRLVGLEWRPLPALPPAPGQRSQFGLAGPFAGAHGEALLVGGGTNFPLLTPWENGRKVWWKDIFVLERRSDGVMRWVEKTYELPRPLAHGMSFSTPRGIICAGGCDAMQCYADVFRLAWDPRTRAVVTTLLPPLPAPLAYMAGAHIGSQLFVAGGQELAGDVTASAAFYVLDLSQEGHPAQFQWHRLPTWPGPPRMLSVAAASGGKFYLFSGRRPRTGAPTQILTDAYAFDPTTKTWSALGQIEVGEVAAPLSVMAGAATDLGNEILVFSGDRGDLFLQLEAHDLEIVARRHQLATAAPVERRELEQEIAERLLAKKQIYESHPGFAREVLAYDPLRDRWRVVAESPFPGQSVTIAVPWQGAVVLPNGEVRPGTRTAAITQVVPLFA